jgi:ADP-ribosyl-[dinitrogen reductase] hydrolase
MDDTATYAGDLPLQQRIRGCLLAGACGDALGAAVEFLRLREIRARYGPAGIRDPDTAYGRIGAITDDTQMTLFTAEGLIRASVRWSLKGICHPPGVVHHAYLRWLVTQGVEPTHLGSTVGKDGWLIGVRSLWSRRAPGNTCLSALAAARRFGEPVPNDSKGCGGVMRVAPVGLTGPALGDLGRVFELGCETARLTHGHPTGYLAAGYLAALIASLAGGRALSDALDEASGVLARRPEGGGEVARAIDAACETAARGAASTAALASLGDGWVAEEALGMSVYCALAVTDLKEALVLAVNHDGDSDSTGAITGNILGTVHGWQALPPEWLAHLELRKEIEAVADDLTACFGPNPPDAESLWDRYPGW